MKKGLFTTVPLIAALLALGCAPAAPSTVDFTDSAEDGQAARPPTIQVFVGPISGGAPFLDSLRAARRSVHMTMYMVTSRDVIDALVALHRSGVEVSVVLNRFFPRDGNPNERAFDRLKHAGLDVTWASSANRFTHAKFAIIDGRHLWVMTMNAMRRAMTRNREFLVLDTKGDHVAEAEALFQADRAHVPPILSPFRNGYHDEETGHLIVGPENAEAQLIALIDSATQELMVAAPFLSEPHIEAAFFRAIERGVLVRLNTRNKPGRTLQAATRLKEKGAEIALMEEPVLHAKAIVADAVRAYTGSLNFTVTSLHKNRELGIIIVAPAAVQELRAALIHDFARATKL